MVQIGSPEIHGRYCRFVRFIEKRTGINKNTSNSDQKHDVLKARTTLVNSHETNS